MQASDDDLFPVRLNGQVIECISLEDAVAVKTAADILHGDDLTPYTPNQLERLAEVLLRYGHRRAAILLTKGDGDA